MKLQNPSEKEVKAVSALDASKRYSYLIKKVADTQAVWALWKDESWFVYDSPDQQKLFPVWSAPQFAEAFAEEKWSGAAQPIQAERFIDTFLPTLTADGVLPVVFPTSADEGVIKDPKDLAKDLAAELEKYLF